jgi:tetratricopeptide (TPR) repeat protein
MHCCPSLAGLLGLMLLGGVPGVAAGEEVGQALQQAIQEDVGLRGLPHPETPTPEAKRFVRSEGGGLESPSGEALVVLRLPEHTGVALVARAEGVYWTLIRSPGGRAVPNGPFAVPAVLPDPVSVQGLLQQLDGASRRERAALLDQLCPAPGAWSGIDAALAALEDEQAQRLRALLLGQISSRIRAFIGRTGDGGFFEGQFRPLARYGAGGERALFRILLDRSETPQIRSYAAQALGELGDSNTVEKLNQALDRQRVRQANVQEAIGYALARLGDRRRVDRLIATLRQRIDRAEEGNVNVGLVFQLAQVYVRLGEYEPCLDLYRKVLEQDPTGSRAGLTRYNMACVLSVQGRVDEAFAELEKAIELGGVDFDWMQKDGDLVRLHDDPRWEQLLARQKPSGPRRIY